MSVRLHVNVDHVATLRNARGTPYPDPVRAAQECLAAGADGITAHLREDRRHIADHDVERLGGLLREVGRTFNFEMAATDEMVAIATRVKPNVCSLVPERREERTTEGGLDVAGGGAPLARRVRALLDAGIHVSMFIAADTAQIEASRALGAIQVELHTGEYAHGREGELSRLAEGARKAHALGLQVAAGHGLTQDNVPAVVAIPFVEELNIGHAVVADAVFVGLTSAVRGFQDAIAKGLAAR
ncbi:MAG TPA: pyridoxine 5'-phosphate synthase [Polyangiaceae bacterium]|jgi:pyridoxine 5-phosphate synthase